MFDIGFSEIVLVCIVGLVVLGPQRLPVAIRTVMSWVRTIRGLAANVQNELKQELKLQELQESIKKAESLNLKALSPELGNTVEELKASADKLRAELEQKANDTNTTFQDQVVQLKQAQATKSAVENGGENDNLHPGADQYNPMANYDILDVEDYAEPQTEALAATKTTEKTTALSPAELAEQEEIELDKKLAHYINQYDPDNPLPANTASAHLAKASEKS
ncbi:Sec-independent protein translocase subunit TatB [Aggregatibacter actinomycetemcomitans]|uniref:Sec-independent protein translocase protein TatB n=1 Tax=Aggregatibacter actinomycetemcomitans TaxID=714 RepID=UPI00197B1D16|nr:Sec-independent protein translocase protein TatB [Aggregatibacter actinomycetemcomitans]MBN6068578.1 Sec-independent protein translocase subunit TatB [Aggregatibacter actinomycetemcomitans]MBN6085456.1 Sec-independent protein translocase subunit TatB [Aggregatibacter actinomycetemcomitans]